MPETLHRCPVCKREFYSRPNALYCCKSCKIRAYKDRKRKKA